MKTTKELKIWSLRMVLFTILLSGLSVQKVYSFCNSTEIIINGKWYSNQEKVNTRSLPSIPITACHLFPSQPAPMARTSTLKTHLRTVTYKLPSPVIKQEK